MQSAPLIVPEVTLLKTIISLEFSQTEVVPEITPGDNELSFYN